MPTKVKLYKDHPQADAIDRVLSLRSDDKSWDEVASEMEMGQGRCMYLYMIGTTGEDDVIEDDKNLAKSIVTARDKQNLSWGQISARTLGVVPEGRVKSIYAETTGNETHGLRLEGKGGRPAAENGAAPKKASAAKKGTAKTPAGAKGGKGTSDVNPEKKLLVDMNLKEISDRLEGAKVSVKTGAGIKTGLVKKVTSLKGGKVSFLNEKDETRTISVASIDRVSGAK